MSEADLTLGVLPRIFGGEAVPEPVLQVLGHKDIQRNTKEDQKRVRLLLNDGKFINSFVMLSDKLGHLVRENVITTYTVVKVKKYVCNKMSNQDKKVIIILKLEVLQTGELVGKTIGSPDPIESDGKLPTPDSTLDQHAGEPTMARAGPCMGRQPKGSSLASIPGSSPSFVEDLGR